MVESNTVVTPEMLKQFSDPEEPILFQEKVNKLSRWNMSQNRVLAITFNHVYLFSGNKISRKHKISNLAAIIKASQSAEVVLHYPQAKDLRMAGLSKAKVQELQDSIQLRYSSVNSAKTLKIFCIPTKSLKDYSQDNNKYDFSNLPDIKYRMVKEEIKGSEDEPVQEAGNNIDDLLDSQAAGELDFSENRFSMKRRIDDEASSTSSKDTNDSALNAQNFTGDFRRSTLMKARRKTDNLKLEDFEIQSQLGRGTFGRVYLAKLVTTQQLYAIKAIRKDVLIEYDQIQSVLLEKDILFSADHPFLVGMDYLFQSETRLYFVMPFVNGGELYKVFQEQKRFTEETVKFYAYQIILAIGELHSKEIMHRDLKLENILVDQTGYLKIIDYGLAKILGDGELAMSYCGTPEYLAPEMVNHQGHDFTVDWWAVGVLIYEMLIGVTPFFNRNRQVLMSKIKHSKIVFPDRKHYRIEYSDDVVDLITRLLKKDRTQRLGATEDSKEILNHPWFNSIDKAKLESYEIDPPFKPAVGEGPVNADYFNVLTEKADLAETVIPKENLKLIKQEKDQFAEFNIRRK